MQSTCHVSLWLSSADVWARTTRDRGCPEQWPQSPAGNKITSDDEHPPPRSLGQCNARCRGVALEQLDDGSPTQRATTSYTRVLCIHAWCDCETRGNGFSGCFIIIKWRGQGCESSGQISGCDAAKSEPSSGETGCRFRFTMATMTEGPLHCSRRVRTS
jgi:hypothetical protein